MVIFISIAYKELYNQSMSLVLLKEPHISADTYKKVLGNNVPLIGNNVDFILESVNKYLMALAKEQIRLVVEWSEKSQGFTTAH